MRRGDGEDLGRREVVDERRGGHVVLAELQLGQQQPPLPVGQLDGGFSELPEEADGGVEPEGNAVASDLGARLGRLVSRLPRLQQEIVSLRIVVGLSATETAEALGITPGRVRIQQYRALAKLRDMMAADERLWAAGA